MTESVGDLTFNDGKHTAAYDGESFNGYAMMLGLNRNTRHWNGFAFYTGMSPNFRADNGFVFQNNTHQLFGRQGYTFYVEDSFVQRIQPSIMGGYWWNFEGQRKDQFVWANLRLTMKKQTFVDMQYLIRSDEVFRDIDFRKLRRLILNVNSNFSEPLKVGAFTSIGRSIARNLETPKMGNNRDFSAWATIKPHTRLVIEPNFSWASLYDQETDDKIFSGYILRSRTNFQFTRHLFLRLVTQYNDFSEQFEIDPLITYRINPFTAFYIGSTHDIRHFGGSGYTQTDRQLFFKFQYLVRV